MSTPPTAAAIRLMLADVDGTLVTPDKVLTDRAIEAVRRLHAAGILFAITSGRPPRGMDMLIEPLDITTPIAAFNGGLLVDRNMSVIEQRVLPEDLVRPVADLIGSFGLDVWVYRGADWYVPDPKGSHVAQESATVRFEPKVMTSLDGLTSNVAKLVGVSDDLDAVARASSAAHDKFGDHVSAAGPSRTTSTSPIRTRIRARSPAICPRSTRSRRRPWPRLATSRTTCWMFAHSGLSIAMGNASLEVKRSARRVTTSDTDEGFANAVEKFVLPRS